MPLENALFSERTVLAFQVVGVADGSGGTVRALSHSGGIGNRPERSRHKLGTGAGNPLRCTGRVSDLGGRRTVYVRAIEVVGMSLVPAFDGLGAAITDESK